jgi:hypothetical protein
MGGKSDGGAGDGPEVAVCRGELNKWSEEFLLCGLQFVFGIILFSEGVMPSWQSLDRYSGQR